MEVLNKDIKHLMVKAARWRKENQGCQSAKLTRIKSPDALRQREYHQDFIDAMAAIQAEPETDNPHSHPEKFDVPDPVKHPSINNDYLNNINDELYYVEIELGKHASAQDSGGMTPALHLRITAKMERIIRYLDYSTKERVHMEYPESGINSTEA